MSDKTTTNDRFYRKCQLWGWFLFIISALFFIATSLRSGDMLGLLGGLFFLIACIVFLLPFFNSRSDSK